MRFVVASLALVLSTGCEDSPHEGGHRHRQHEPQEPQEPQDPCIDYTDAAIACNQTALDAGLDVDVETADPEGFCAAMDYMTDEQWICLTQVYAEGDCSTYEGLDAIFVATDGC